MKNLSAMLLCDFYKISHREQYPKGIENVYSTWTPRISRMEGVDHVVAFGFQAFIKKYLIDFFNENFFARPWKDVKEEYIRIIKHTLGNDDPDTKHIAELYGLGYLPISIRALPEGMVTPLRVPHLTIENTMPQFFWLTNYIESLASAEMWKPANSATIALEYKKIFNEYAMKTVGDTGFVPFQGHDFSFRGMSGLEDAVSSGMGHLLSFVGTDSIPAIVGLENYYNADVTKELVGTSIPATEHSVMCANGTSNIEQELAAFKRLITEVYPKGFVSIVSDTVDFWSIIANVVAGLKPEILARDGRVVIRPDSGDPAKIICGDPNASTEMERKGLVECLWDIFGGTSTATGFKLLDSHIGCIYGEAITTKVARNICRGLENKGFASINCVYGIGSFTYQYNTRDTLGFAYKSTSCRIDGKDIALFKNPKTDDGSKKSQKGRVAVLKSGDKIGYVDQLSTVHEDDLMREVFRNGTLLVDHKLSDIRARIEASK
jgi:nicotinamide phosphoribosyltransferase